MTKSTQVLVFAATTALAAGFSLTEASATHRRHHVVIHQTGCFDRLPAYGVDGCGLPEFSYGQGSCWRRVEAYIRQGPRANRTFVCG
jgi:hypothetical protein